MIKKYSSFERRETMTQNQFSEVLEDIERFSIGDNPKEIKQRINKLPKKEKKKLEKKLEKKIYEVVSNPTVNSLMKILVAMEAFMPVEESTKIQIGDEQFYPLPIKKENPHWN